MEGLVSECVFMCITFHKYCFFFLPFGIVDVAAAKAMADSD